MKKGQYIIGLLVLTFCGQREYNDLGDNQLTRQNVELTDSVDDDQLAISGLLADNIVLTDSVEFKTGSLKEIILKNDALLGITDIYNYRNTRNDSFRLQLYNSSKYRLLANKGCDAYKHLYIVKERKKREMREVFLKPGQKPYVGLYLLIVDSKNREIKTTAISEKMNYMAMTPLHGATKAHLEPDSILTILHVSKTCTDVVPSKCITVKREQIYKLRCNKLELIKADTAVNWDN